MAKNQAGWIIALLAMLIFLGILIYIKQMSVCSAWQYRLESPSDEYFAGEMDKLGEKGWELVFARRALGRDSDNAAYEVILKRRRLWRPTY